MNEEEVGKAIKLSLESGKVKREDLFIVSKVWMTDYHRVEEMCQLSLQKLGLDYIDLYLVHWPVAVETIRAATDKDPGEYKRINIPMYKVWAQMETCYEKGLVKAIGVSNFGVQLLWDMLSYCKVKPSVNEVELHPLYSDPDLVEYCLGNDIVPIAYCPIARGVNAKKTKNVLECDTVTQIAAKHGKTPA